jgi:transcriptional regulator with XRE-family HTH domain
MAWKRALNALEARLGQEGAAEALGVTSRTLRRYKKGTRKPSQDKQNSIENAWSYLRGSKPLKSIKPKNRAKVRKQRVNKVDERLEIGYKTVGQKKYYKAQTLHKEVNVTGLSAMDMLETVNLLYYKEGYTSFGFKIFYEVEEVDEGSPYIEGDSNWITFESWRIDDWQAEGVEGIKSFFKSLNKRIKQMYRIKITKVLDVIIYAIKELPHKKAV